MSSKAPRAAHQFRFEIPTRESVAARLDELAACDDAASREKAADSAMEYILYDDPQIYPVIRDAAVREALHTLSGADTPTTHRPFLYGPQDFRSWRDELLNAPK